MGLFFGMLEQNLQDINRFLLFHLIKDPIVNMSCFGHILRVIAYNLQLVLYEKHLLGLQKQYFVRNTKLIILRFFIVLIMYSV